MTQEEKNTNKEAEDQQKANQAENKATEMKEPQAEETKAEETTAEEIKAEEAKAEETEETKAEEEKTEEAEETKAEETKSEETKAEEPKEEVSAENAEQKEASDDEAAADEDEENKGAPIVDKVELNEEEKEKLRPADEVIEEFKEVAPEEKEEEEFDWDSIGKKQDVYSEKERNNLEQIYDKTLSSIVEQEVVEGTVVAKTNREVVINIGFKSDGVVPVSEFRYNPDLKSGDVVEVYVESQEDTSGQLMLSHKKARILKSWERINEAYDQDKIINGYIKSRTKGGLIVEVFGLEAFLPGSQIDVKPIRDYDIYVGKSMEFKVVKINHEFKNVVVSHKALIEDELEQQKAEIMTKLEKGQVLEGTVKNITSYGVFVDLGGVDGLVHITDLSWGRINHPEEIVNLDEKIKVVILDFDDEKKRIALGLKQLTPHPWDALDTNLKVGDKIKGKVVVIADYGAFVEIAPGVEGLIHVSEMSWSQHLRTAQDFLKVGDEVEAVILTLDREERKMSLGMKQLIPDPWENIQGRYPKASKHKAKVMNFTNFGIFVELEEGVDGLIHISDLSWSKKIKHPAEFTKIGEEIEVVVLDVDEENRRLSLGHKQLEENPWDVFESVFTVGSVHKGTVTSINDKGAIVSLPYGVEGFAPNRHLKKEDGSNVKADETIDFMVIEFSKESKKIILSHSRIYEEVQHEERAKAKAKSRGEDQSTKKQVRKMKDNLERTTLGDLDALASLKQEMEASENKIAQEKKDEEEAKKQANKENKENKEN